MSKSSHPKDGFESNSQSPQDENAGEEAADRICKLVSEYVNKLEKLTHKMEKFLDDFEEAKASGPISPEDFDQRHLRCEAISAYLSNLLPGIDDLARHASQLVEHGKIEIAALAELRVRTRELEAIRQYAISVINFAQLNP